MLTLTLRVDQLFSRIHIRGGQLLLDLGHVLRMHNIEPALAQQLGLGIVQHLRHRLGHVHDATPVASDHKQESVGRLQDQHLQLLVGQERRLVLAFGVRVGRSPNGLQMLNGHSQNGQLIQFSGHRRAHRNHGRQFGDVEIHLVPTALLDLAVVLPGESIGKT